MAEQYPENADLHGGDQRIDALYTNLALAHQLKNDPVIEETWQNLRDHAEPLTEPTEDELIIDYFRQRTHEPQELDELFEIAARCDAGILPYYDHPEQAFEDLGTALEETGAVLADFLQASEEPGGKAAEQAEAQSLEDVMTELLRSSGIPLDVAPNMSKDLIALTDLALSEGRNTTDEEFAAFRLKHGIGTDTDRKAAIVLDDTTYVAFAEALTTGFIADGVTPEEAPKVAADFMALMEKASQEDRDITDEEMSTFLQRLAKNNMPQN